MSSILESIKKLLGIEPTEYAFDTDILIAINTVFAILNQLGVGPKEGFLVTSESEEWSDFLGDNTMLEMVKMYTYLRVKMIFDPPQSGSYAETIKAQANELEFRISVTVDSENTFSVGD